MLPKLQVAAIIWCIIKQFERCSHKLRTMIKHANYNFSKNWKILNQEASQQAGIISERCR